MILKNNLVISEAKKEDIPYLVLLLQQLFTIEKDFIFDAKKHEQGLHLLIEDSNNIVTIAKFEDEIIAMVTIQIIISTAVGAKVGLIEDFIVHDDYKSLGIGSHLFAHIQQKAQEKNLKRLQLVCDNHNENAKEFYTKKAFKKSNLSAWYYLME